MKVTKQQIVRLYKILMGNLGLLEQRVRVLEDMAKMLKKKKEE
ncbi:hypothetical protein JDFR1000234_55 [uncultured archaeal virus]|uniref:Uncharacterized protein n=1 Tax=uncultured archaeal virus TaxID=1960247 RepID=A0A1S5Y382_9VIRU|nr:hypothetical protein JDFR1000234_55 [uncultured archaeal virus]